MPKLSARGSQFSRPMNRVPTKGRRETVHSLCRELGAVVYFIRTMDDLIKIGYTTDLAMRKKSFRVDWADVLALERGTIDDESVLHERFAPHRARGREYYHPVPELITYINEVRARWGIDSR